jgi:4-oxalocrotonate tautomerase
VPHVTVKLWPGETDEAKQRLSDAIVDSAVRILGCNEASLSVAFIDVSPADWMDEVYEPDIARRAANLTKRPGYGPAAAR